MRVGILSFLRTDVNYRGLSLHASYAILLVPWTYRRRCDGAVLRSLLRDRLSRVYEVCGWRAACVDSMC